MLYNSIKRKKKTIFKNKRNSLNKINLMNMLIKSQNMIISSLNGTNKELIPFIYGNRNKYNIIDLKISILFFIRIYSIIKKILFFKKNILIIGDSTDVSFLFTNTFIKKSKNIYFLNKPWINGVITNKKINKNLFFNEQNFYLIIIIKSSLDDNFLKKELSYFNIPIISLVAIKQNLKGINYPLLSNISNIKSIYTLIYLLKKPFLNNE
jgi:ribosomal protein S2